MHRIRRVFIRAAWLVGGLFGAVLTVSFFFDDMGVRKYLSMLRHQQDIEQAIRDLEEINRELRVDVRRVQQDPARIEELARERLGFVRKGETVYQVVPDAAAPKGR